MEPYAQNGRAPSEESVPLKADVQDILPIIKRFMYSEREVFLRELISNAIDALSKISRIALSNETACLDTEPLRVEVALDPMRSTVTIRDNGIGMTREEIIRYINQIAFSGAKEFLEQYPKGESDLIGRFGLGFYSSFIVSESVEIDTLSWLPGAGGCCWSNDGGPITRIGPNRRKERGTAVICHLSPDAKEFLNSEKVETVIRHYLNYAPYPVLLDGRQINMGTAPWHLSPLERDTLPRERYLSFYEQLNPNENRPLAWFHAESDYPVQAKALLFVPDRRAESPGSVRFFANRTFVCDRSAGLLPEWLEFLDGIVDSGDLPINVAREKFQQDKQVSALRNHLATKSVSFFTDLFERKRADFSEIWQRFGSYLKIGYLESTANGQKHLSSRLEKVLLFPSSRKNFTTIEEYLERRPAQSGKVIVYLTDPQAQHAHLELLRNRNREVLWLTDRIDTVLMRTLADIHRDWSFVRVDQVEIAEIHNAPGLAPTEPVREIDWTYVTDLFREIVGTDAGKIAVQSLPSIDIPAVLSVTEAAAFQDDLRRLVGKQGSSAGHWHLALNSNSPLIQRLGATGSRLRSLELAEAIAGQIWDNVRLSANLLEGDQFTAALQRTREFLLLVAKKTSIAKDCD